MANLLETITASKLPKVATPDASLYRFVVSSNDTIATAPMYYITDKIQEALDAANSSAAFGASLVPDIDDANQRSLLAYNWANETRSMTFDADGYFDTEKNLRSLSIETKHLMIGTRSQQFSLPNVKFSFSSNFLTLNYSAGKISHLTIDPDEIKEWTISAGSISLTSAYHYIFVKAVKGGTTATIIGSTTPIKVEEVPGFYHFEVGYASSIAEGIRLFKTNYGFAQINPAEISIGRLASPTGGNYIALNQDNIEIVANSIVFRAPDDSYKDLGQVIEAVDANFDNLNDTRDYVNTTLQTDLADLKNRADGVIESWFYSHTPNLTNLPASNWTTNEQKDSHIGDTFTNMQEFVDNTTTPDAGKAWRFAKNGDNSYSWNLIANSDSTKALIEAGKAKDTADSKRRVFIAQPFPPYDLGDLWSQGTSGDLMRCKFARTSGVYVATDWEKASKYTDDTRAIQAETAAKAYADSQAILTKIMMESYMDGIINDAERLAITAAENALTEAYNRLLELSQNLASGGVQLLREYDIAFNFKYWGGTGTAGNIDVNNITVIEAFAMGGLIGSTSFDYVDENGKKLEIIY